MPTDSFDNLAEFTVCLSEIYSIIECSGVESAIILGDLNSHPGELFWRELLAFNSDHLWSCADVDILGINSNTYTYISEVHGCRRWLDHCVVTSSARKSVIDAYVRYNDVYWSDHYPLVIVCDFTCIPSKFVNSNSVKNLILWGQRPPCSVNKYNKLCNAELREIDFPAEFVSCCNNMCTDQSHKLILNNMYDKIVSVLQLSSTETSQSGPGRSGKRPIVGWNKHVGDAHREARLKYRFWCQHGKPREGFIFEQMRLSKNYYKSRLKWCQKNAEQIKMDIIASQHLNKKFGKFWKETKRMNLKPGLPVSVEGESCPRNIANMFKKHFTVKSPLGQVAYDNNVCTDRSGVRFTAKEVKQAIRSITGGKSPGHDSLSIEHLVHAGVHLPRVLAMFYSCCLVHSYLPDDMMRCVVVPVVKDKMGDLSVTNNYRPISLATVLAKVFDRLMERQLDNYLKLNERQFGFKEGCSTESAILVLKSTIKYYTDRRTPVYGCFLDLSKAFDLVQYDILWQKLIKTGFPVALVSVFRYWYSNQVNVVRWGGTYSDEYRMECGVRQGGLTSPLLFNLYMNALIEELSNQPYGCYIDNVSVNNISYADDMVLLGPSINAITKLLNICGEYTKQHGLVYNIKKSVYMLFSARKRAQSVLPPVVMNGSPLKRVAEFKYLGHYVNEDLTDDKDMDRERRALSVRSNMVARRFSRCTKAVKITLFKAYCLSFYACSLWVNHLQKTGRALRVQYNNAFRMLMGLPRWCSASGMFAEARTPDFYAVMRSRAASLLHRVRGSTNTVLNTAVDRWDNCFLNHWVQLSLLPNKK
ncbi:hypothetical protein JYU34_006995 [Plutella xylostella]|uniref:Reverse transcriptase domain-containing protein n=1 Tax=Plutella xylostella TaxID=51655 RepID=A0ABQ7QTD4_PLUXY|nr:hypothetical protein JYU34_006995 [Plutella xylostella]